MDIWASHEGTSQAPPIDVPWALTLGVGAALETTRSLWALVTVSRPRIPTTDDTSAAGTSGAVAVAMPVRPPGAVKWRSAAPVVDSTWAAVPRNRTKRSSDETPVTSRPLDDSQLDVMARLVGPAPNRAPN